MTHSPHDHTASASAPGPAGQQAAIDPVCGMEVLPEEAAGSAVHAGVTYWFCNPGCREKFVAEPERYLAPRPASDPAAEGDGRVYTCPMHPEVRQIGPGACPKCGMALEP